MQNASGVLEYIYLHAAIMLSHSWQALTHVSAAAATAAGEHHDRFHQGPCVLCSFCWNRHQ
jgi:hypothetical protein